MPYFPSLLSRASLGAVQYPSPRSCLTPLLLAHQPQHGDRWEGRAQPSVLTTPETLVAKPEGAACSAQATHIFHTEFSPHCYCRLLLEQSTALKQHWVTRLTPNTCFLLLSSLMHCNPSQLRTIFTSNYIKESTSTAITTIYSDLMSA